MNKIFWALRIQLSNFLDGFRWYRKFHGGKWYCLHLRSLDRSMTFWTLKYDYDNLAAWRDRQNHRIFIDIIEIEDYS